MLSQRSRGFGQRGLSLVELMVGIAVGLIVVAAATLLVTSQLSDNRRLLLETQVQQDLRATSDIIVRELRRAGASANAEDYVANAVLPPTASPGAGEPQRNAYLTLTTTAGPPPQVIFYYKRADGTSGPYGYQLVNGVIQTDVSAGQQTNWQDLTDSNVLVVDQFVITQDPWTPVKLPCAKPCPVVAGQPPDYCYPSIEVRTLTVKIVAHARADASISRTIQNKARMRNDNVVFPAPLPPVVPGAPLPPACPA